jgi:raffinose/stachyose/melibiose transport system substrate-binding protein
MKKTAICALGAVVTLALAGCAGQSEPGTDTIETGPATGTLTYESWTPTEATFDTIIEGFTAENPDVELTGTLAPLEDYQTSLQTQLRSGSGPDVFVVSPGAMYNQYREYFEPLDAYAEEFDGEDWTEIYNAEPLARAQTDGVTYGLPVGYGVAGFLWVNLTLLAEAGVEVPTTYDELVQASEKLKAAGIQPIALGGKDGWMNMDYYLSIAASLDKEALYAALEGTGEWTDPALVEAFEIWSGFFEDGVVQEGAIGAATYSDTYDLFTQGKAAFFANGSWNLDMYVNSLDRIAGYDIDAIALPVPGAENGAPITGDVSGIVVVNKASKNKAAAYQLASYMSRGDGAQVLLDAFLDFPVTNDGKTPTAAPEESKTARASIEKLIEDKLAGYRQVPLASVSEALSAALAGVATGDVTGEEAAQRVQDAAENG